MNSTTLLVIPLTFLVSGVVQGLTGFGLGITAMSVLALFVPMREAVPLVALLTTIACFATAGKFRKDVDWREFTPLLLALLVGIPIGVLSLDALPGGLIRRLLGAALLLACAQDILVPATRALPRWTAGIFGLASGVLSGALNVGGPALLLYLRGRKTSTPALIATLHLLFVFSGAFRSGLLVVSGFITGKIIGWLLAALPLAVLGIFLGSRIREGIPEKVMNRLLQAAVALLGIFYLVRG